MTKKNNIYSLQIYISIRPMIQYSRACLLIEILGQDCVVPGRMCIVDMSTMNSLAAIPSTQRLKLNVGSWVPGEAALAELRRMGSPLSFFVSSEEGSGDDLSSRHVAACREAKAQPGKLFEEGWPNWLPSSSKFDLKEEIRRTMNFVIGAGVLALDPGARPPTVESAKKVLMAAADVYKKGNT